jgi:hypothetical protein
MQRLKVLRCATHDKFSGGKEKAGKGCRKTRAKSEGLLWRCFACGGKVFSGLIFLFLLVSRQKESLSGSG